MKDATIIGFRVLIDSDGLFVTEAAEFPDEHISKVFRDKDTQILVRAAIKSFKEQTGDMHSKLEADIDAINKIL
tara:strand:- start:300 stop:521 length:222 start_codon:yes stop_codon:yes gene_type:complete